VGVGAIYEDGEEEGLFVRKQMVTRGVICGLRLGGSVAFSSALIPIQSITIRFRSTEYGG
jgi:hypothetical protein